MTFLCYDALPNSDNSHAVCSVCFIVTFLSMMSGLTPSQLEKAKQATDVLSKIPVSVTGWTSASMASPQRGTSRSTPDLGQPGEIFLSPVYNLKFYVAVGFQGEQSNSKNSGQFFFLTRHIFSIRGLKIIVFIIFIMYLCSS